MKVNKMRFIRLVSKALSVFGIFMSSYVGANEDSVASLDEQRSMRLLQRFTGTYLRGSLNGNDEAIIVIESGSLTFWYSVGNIPSSSFQMRLEDLNRKSTETGETSRGTATIETEYFLVDDELGLTIIKTGYMWRSVEKLTLHLKGNGLIERHTRRYYRPGYGFHPWVNDNSYSAKVNTLDHQTTMLKISEIPIPVDIYIEMLRARPTTYVRLSEATSGEGLRELLEKGEYDTITDDDLKPKHPPSSAQILDFQPKFESQNCIDTLRP